jgi:sortase B
MQTFGCIREHTDWLKEVSGRSDFRANLEISAYDMVITLSTCAYRFENARYVWAGLTDCTGQPALLFCLIGD